MDLKQISEVIYKASNNGRPSATSRTFSEKDIEQFAKMSFGNVLRQRYFDDKKMNDGGNLDMIGGSLDIKEYELTEPNTQGMRRAVMKDEVVRMPRSMDVTNIYPVATGDCDGSVGDSITLVQPGEENFYLSPDFEFFQFAVQKGKGINTYHLPACITKIQVERIYVSDGLDIPLDIAFEISLSVLGVVLKIKEFLPTADNSFDPNKNELRYQLEKQEAKK
jgi:hypothetical protein